MRVWVDILTPKQVLFFHPVIETLRSHGHEVLATSRGYREVEQLASMAGLTLTFVGSRGGKEPLDQFRRSLERIGLLTPKVVDFSPDVAVSVASADCARISYAIRVPHVAVNDSPHSIVAGKLSLPLSHHLLSPWIIPYSAWSAFGITKKQVTTYKALDPAAWLKRRKSSSSPRASQRGGKRRATILVRLEESYAPYLSGTDESWSARVLERLAQDFQGQRLVALCRYDDQLEGMRKRFGSSFAIPDQAVDGAALIEQSDVFVGLGGTMTAEAALLGVPAISGFQGAALYTEKFLLAKKLLIRANSAAEVSRSVRRALDPRFAAGFRSRGRALLKWMEDPVSRVVAQLESLKPRR